MNAPVIAGVPTDCLKPSDLLWASLLDKPLLFPPNAHSHGSGDLPGNIAFKDQANTFTANQTVTGTITASGAVAASAISESSVAATGTGGLVRAVSPTLVTPNLGTPSALVVTNASGTASININGTVGATTRNMGAFTNATAAQFLDDTAIGGVASYGTFQLGFFGVSPAGWSHPSGGTFRGLIQHGNNGCYWTAYGTGLASGTVTYGLQPAATGGVALEINNGTAGTFRDLNLRNLTASGTLAASGATSLKNLTVQGIAGGYETILQLKDSSAANIGSIHAYAGEAIFQAAQFVALSTIGLSRHRLANDGLFIPDGSGGTGAQSKIFFGDTYNAVYPTAITAAAGVVQINNGTTGTLRDLNLRNLTASGTVTGVCLAVTGNSTPPANGLEYSSAQATTWVKSASAYCFGGDGAIGGIVIPNNAYPIRWTTNVSLYGSVSGTLRVGSNGTTNDAAGAIACGNITASGTISAAGTSPLLIATVTTGTNSSILRLVNPSQTWDVENQYVGGATVGMFRIRNNATGADALTIHPSNNGATFAGNVTASGTLALGPTSGAAPTISSNNLEANNIIVNGGAGNMALHVVGSAGTVVCGSGRLGFGDSHYVSWHGNADGTGGGDTRLSRNAANVLQIGTTANNALGSLLLTNLTASGNIIAKGSVTTDATLGYVNVRMGAGGTNPRLILDGGTSGAITQFENNSGLTRILSDSAVLLSIANSTGALTIPGTVTINSTGGSSPTLALNYNGTPWYNYVNSSDYYSFAKQGSANVLTLKQNIGVDVTGNITASGTVSSPQNSTGERFGVGTTANYAGVAVGYGASAGWSGIAIGMQASTATSYGSGGIAIGYQAYSVENAVAIGSRTNNGTANTCLIGNITVPLSLVVPNGNITASGIIKQLGANGQYLQLDLSVAGAYSYPKLQTNSDNLTIQNATQSLTLGGSYYAFTSNGILSLNLPSAYGDAGAVFRRASPAGGGNLAAFYDYGNTLKVSISETGNITTSGTVTSAFQSLSTDPTGADLATGLTRIIKNTSSGTTKIWLNDGGTFKSLTFV